MQEDIFIMTPSEAITMLKNKNKSRSHTGCVLQNDWMALYENAGTEFSVEGDRNSNATACLQYFKRKGIKVKVLSRTIDGVGYLTVIKK